jgi:uncharacterized phage protein (TIGR01671 family)
MIDYRGTPYWQFGFDEPKPMSDTVLMQFTGLKDKNGREIYEGDILHVNNYSDWIVERRDAGFWIYNQCNPGVYFPLVDSDREVIGNIYENPELLK